MASVRIGLGRFYNGNIIELRNGKQINLQLKLPGFQVEIFVSDELRHLLFTYVASPPVSIEEKPYEPSPKRKPVTIPGPELYPADLYVELVVSAFIEVPAELFQNFNLKNAAAKDEVLALGKAKFVELQSVMDFAAGAIGLSIHRDLLSSPILKDDQRYAYREGTSYGAGGKIRVDVKNPVIVDCEAESVSKLRDKLMTRLNAENWNDLAETFAWLLRGWSSDDRVLQFFSFFTALESIIPKSHNPAYDAFEEMKRKVIESLNCLDDRTERETMTMFIKQLNSPRPLTSSFETWAKLLNSSDWEADVSAFKKYNRKRNLLLHAGDLGDIDDPIVNSDELQTLEQLATKYISLYAFKEEY